MSERQSEAPSVDAFSPVENEAPLRWWRRLRIVSAGEVDAGRRAILLAALTWLPLALWALVTGRFLHADGAEPLLQHYGVHIRCLVAIPLFVLAETALHRAGKAIARQFVASGAVTPALRPAFAATNRGLIRLRDASLPWVVVLGIALAWSVAGAPDLGDDTMSWTLNADGTLGFGGWWLAYVVRPIFSALLLGWIWRVTLVTLWMWRLGRLGLALVPTHPDRTGGISFVEKLPGAFALVTLAMSATLAGRWAHDILHHGASLNSFRAPALAFAVIWNVLLLLPLLALVPVFRATRRRAIPAYGTLVGEQGRLVHRRWIERKPVEDPALLQAAEIGPVADAAAIYAAVKNMRSAPIGKGAVGAIILPMLIPFVLLALLQVPLKDVLLKLIKVLV